MMDGICCNIKNFCAASGRVHASSHLNPHIFSEYTSLSRPTSQFRQNVFQNWLLIEISCQLSYRRLLNFVILCRIVFWFVRIFLVFNQRKRISMRNSDSDSPVCYTVTVKIFFPSLVFKASYFRLSDSGWSTTLSNTSLTFFDVTAQWIISVV